MPNLQAPPLAPLVFGLQGRISRRSWWIWGVAVPLGLSLYFTVLLRVAGAPARATEVAVNLLLLWPVVAASAKRWHDRDKSAAWVLVALIPAIGWLWVLVENGLLRGDAGSNRYGQPPP